MPLKGLTVIELAGLAPGPLCGKVLLDFGATVIQVNPVTGPSMQDLLSNGKKSIAVNLKCKAGVEIFRKLSMNADILVEPFRKGIMEKLCLGPDSLLKNNPKLIYARLTGYGQHGYFSSMAGHDLNYLGITGLLSMYGWREKHPTPPCNFSEFAGGSLICVTGILLALIDRSKTGLGQVVDSNIVEGVSYIGSWLMKFQNTLFPNKRGSNWLDGGAHFYDTYETSDGKFMSVAALEPKFYAELLTKLNLSHDDVPQTGNTQKCREILQNKFKEKTQKEWCQIFDLSDACVAPVLTINEAAEHRHNVDRKSFVKDSDGLFIPVRAPRLSRYENEKTYENVPVPLLGRHTSEILMELGYSYEEIQRLCHDGTIHAANNVSKL